jgi:hypothetical protein|tara:strand:- start:58 stop:285 length:228 start_codon:yes stop_codon:yes gene_type:complete
MKLVYWIAVCTDDSSAYNLRAKTRKECKRLLEEQKARGGARFSDNIKRVEVHYASGFDLIDQALGEGGIEPGDWD